MALRKVLEVFTIACKKKQTEEGTSVCLILYS